MKEIYYIGGSPCSGKSTVAERLSKRYGLYYFKVDDFLEKYMEMGAVRKKPSCAAALAMTPEQTWMREPELQNREELEIYREIFEFITADLAALDTKRPVLTEGAAFLPELMKQAGVDAGHYINITPTEEFQYSHYKERPWIAYILEGCSDKQAAFDNWMKRDALFAVYVREQAKKLQYRELVVDGTADITEISRIVCDTFEFRFV